MSMTVLGQIEQAEAEAEQIVRDAQLQARDMIKSVEEAGVHQAREAQKALGEEVQRRIEEARVLIGDEIKSLELRRAAEREAMRERARARVQDAGRLVFERIVADGRR